MTEEERKAEIDKLEKRVEFLYRRGSNDEKVNSRLRELKNQQAKW